MTLNTEEGVLAELRVREPLLEPDADVDRWSTAITQLMAALPVSSTWLARLVDEFAATRNPEFANSLAFTLAGAANDAERAQWVAPLAVKAMVALDVASPWPRLNLCTTIQRLLIFEALRPDVGRPVPGLANLLSSSLSGPDDLQAVAAIVVYQLRCRGIDDALEPAERDSIERLVLTHVESPNEELADFATGLRDWLLAHPPADA